MISESHKKIFYGARKNFVDLWWDYEFHFLGELNSELNCSLCGIWAGNESCIFARSYKDVN